MKPTTEHASTDGLGSRHILGMRVDALNYDEASDRILRWASAGESRYVSVATVNNVMEAHDDPEFMRIMNDADMVTSDGMPLVWGLRRLGCPAAERVYGPDLTPVLCAEAAQRGIPIGLYGGAPNALDDLSAVLERRFPELNIAYKVSPPFRVLTEEEDREIINDIRASKARILFIGLSTPKQERFMIAHRDKVDAVMVGVGAAFDFLAGRKRQAPLAMQKSGTEWLFRLVTEPRRLWRRYLYRNPRFMALFGAQLLGVGGQEIRARFAGPKNPQGKERLL